VASTISHIDIAAEEQNVGQHRKPCHEQREQPERCSKPVHSSNQSQVEREGLTQHNEEPSGNQRSRPYVSQSLPGIRRQPVDEQEGQRGRNGRDGVAGNLTRDPCQSPRAEVWTRILLNEERGQGRGQSYGGEERDERRQDRQAPTARGNEITIGNAINRIEAMVEGTSKAAPNPKKARQAGQGKPATLTARREGCFEGLAGIIARECPVGRFDEKRHYLLLTQQESRDGNQEQGSWYEGNEGVIRQDGGQVTCSGIVVASHRPAREQTSVAAGREPLASAEPCSAATERTAASRTVMSSIHWR